MKLEVVNNQIVNCELCPRLVEFRRTAPPKKGFEDQAHWRKPVPGFGDPEAEILFTGLAPSLQGGNRTGRIFTGDLSGKFLMRCLYKAGFANLATSENRDDGLKLKGCYITAAVKCVPPENKPTKEEFITCSRYYHQEIAFLKNLKCVVAFGKLAFDAFLFYARSVGVETKGAKFSFGARFAFEGLPPLYGCYHPSPQNTQTGVLTEAMFIELLNKIKEQEL